MPQTARPIADVTTGGWTPTPASPADLYSHLNEPSPDSASFVTSPAGGGAFEVKLGPVFTPRTDTGQPVTLTVWLRQTGTGAAAVIDLYQGATRVARKSVTAVPGTFGPVALVLTPAEAAAITNWQDLRARVTASPPAITLSCSATLPNTFYVKSITIGVQTCACVFATIPVPINKQFPYAAVWQNTIPVDPAYGTGCAVTFLYAFRLSCTGDVWTGVMTLFHFIGGAGGACDSTPAVATVYDIGGGTYRFVFTAVFPVGGACLFCNGEELAIVIETTP